MFLITLSLFSAVVLWSFWSAVTICSDFEAQENGDSDRGADTGGKDFRSRLGSNFSS